MGYSGAILKYKNKILFQVRDEKGRNPNKIGLFGGGMEKEESPFGTLRRELKEELGINVTEKDVLNKYDLPLINYHLFDIKLSKLPKKSDLGEGRGMKLMTRGEFLREDKALLRVKIFFWLFT